MRFRTSKRCPRIRKDVSKTAKTVIHCGGYDLRVPVGTRIRTRPDGITTISTPAGSGLIQLLA